VNAKPSLCKKCENQALRYVMHGPHYVPELSCDYDMAAFPAAKECYKFSPRREDEYAEER
jgi:hypothetical protein